MAQTSGIPTLKHSELVAKLSELYKPKQNPNTARERWRRRLVALHGRCPAQTLELEGQSIAVVPVASEYELRAALPAFGATEAVAYVLGYPAIELPVDIAGRFLKRGRVVHIARHERLRQLFGGKRGSARSSLVELEPELVGSRLGQLLLRSGEELRGLSGATGRVNLSLAYERWLATQWQLPRPLSLDNLLAFVARSPRYISFLEATDPQRVPASQGLREELLALLEHKLGIEGALAWKCWLAGCGRQLLQFALLLEADRDNDPEALDALLQGIARTELGLDEADYVSARKRGRLATSVETALELYVGAHPEGEQRSARARLLEEAQSLVSARFHKHLRGSRRLPVVWDLRLDDVGAALEAAMERPDEADHERVGAAIRALELHESLALVDEHRHQCARAEDARRLLAWLIVRPEQHWARGHGPVGKFEALAGWYAQEGGYVDLARRRLRGSAGTDGFRQGVAALLERVDEARARLDRQFAAGIAKWLEAGQPGKRTLPIDKLVDTLGLAYLRAEGGAKRQLAVVVLDGMAWTQAVELLEGLEEREATPWLPLAFNREAGELDRRASFVPVIAALPTMTHVSRSALFGGTPAPSGVEPRSGDDGRRWSAHTGAAALTPTPRKPLLLTPREAFDDKGLTAAAQRAIADPHQPVLAFLINTIDAHLKSDRYDEAPWAIERIKPLRPLLQALREAGRVVLLCSDHGHVPGQRLQYAGTRATSARWRPWLEGDTLKTFEQGIAAPPAWRPPDPEAKGIVLINDERHAYTGKPNQGEHGGATLAEVIAPAILLGSSSHTETTLAGEQSAQLLRHCAPPWWLGEVREGDGHKAAIEAETKKELAKLEREREDEKQEFALKSQSPQLSLAVVAPPDKRGPSDVDLQEQARAEAVARVNAAETKSLARGKKWPKNTSETRELLDKLERNPLFTARAPHTAKQEEVLAALEYLLERKDRAPGEAFARRMGKSDKRVAGYVSNLETVLNVDGYAVLSYERKSKLVVLDRSLLVQGFGL